MVGEVRSSREDCIGGRIRWVEDLCFCQTCMQSFNQGHIEFEGSSIL